MRVFKITREGSESEPKSHEQQMRQCEPSVVGLPSGMVGGRPAHGKNLQTQLPKFIWGLKTPLKALKVV